MRRCAFAGFLLLSASFATRVDAQTAQWTKVWDDEFDYTGIPDPSKWGYETGKVRNKEEQYYSKRADNSGVANGVLTITAKKESYAGAAYTSASLRTRDSFDKYKDLFTVTGGRIETRAKLPDSQGSWSAFWTLGANDNTISWPKCGEIDIMENVQLSPSDNYINHASLHFYDANSTRPNHDPNLTASYDTRTHIPATPYRPSNSLTQDWHTYAIEWYPSDRIDWFVDGNKYQTVDLNRINATGTPFSSPHYILLSYALGGSWGGTIDPNFVSDTLQFDYVRVSQLAVVPEPAPVLIAVPLCGVYLLSLRSRSAGRPSSRPCGAVDRP